MNSQNTQDGSGLGGRVMQFIYHMVPRDMKGTSLLPLNTVKTLPGRHWAAL